MNDGSHVFVFGSNLHGRHGAGAAKEAFNSWQAIEGKSSGRQGMSYAIPTKDLNMYTLPIKEICLWVNHFRSYVQNHPKLTFLITKIGCGLAGYEESEIKPLFKNFPNNCILPKGWRYD